MKEPVAVYQKDEMQVIQREYRKLLRSLKGKMNDEDKVMIKKAYVLATEAHKSQRRKSGEPYILHPIEVARICSDEIGLGPTAIVSALLHDVVEDTPVTLEQVRETFGEKIALIVDGLTKLDSAYNSQSPQAENFKKVISTLVDDVRVALIKMADRLHNLRTLSSMPQHKQLKIAAETSYIYAPLAHRLGLYAIKTEYQDLCMKVTERGSYNEIAKKLQTTKRERDRYVNEFIKPLKIHLDGLKIPYRITGRPKSIYSIYNKIRTKHVAFEEIYDLFAIRIIVDVPKESEKQVCWQIYSIVTDVHIPIPERLKDWITTPKSNGYESLHTTVIGPQGRFVEVQIRSERMDEVAERGYAAHWKYKGVSDQQDVFDDWLDNIREILEHPESDALIFIDHFKSNLFHEEIYVYTPKGDLKILPKGATALDFAFSIHTDIGYRCTAIKVNNKLVPMGHQIQNGDQVSVQTNKNQKPNESWLKMVITGKAKAKIRSAMKEEKRLKGELGKEALMRKFRNMKVDFDEGVETLIKHFSLNSKVDLFYGIAKENIQLSELKIFKVAAGKLVYKESEKAVDPTAPTRQAQRKPRKQRANISKSVLMINGQPADQYDFSYAACCNPLPGDDVFGYLTSSSGLKIHRFNCPNATHLMANYGYRIMNAEWSVNADSTFVAKLRITGIDDGPGMIEKLSNKVSTLLGINIRSFYIDGNEGYFEGNISIMVNNTKQLNNAIKALKGMNGVEKVTRVE